VRATALAPAKVNLCLFLGGVRGSDGRHELVTVFESVSLADRLWLSSGGSSDRVVCPGVDGPNLVERALAELRAAGWSSPPVTISIEKRIPVAAGMGGGSADAAAALRLARAVEPVADETLMAIAAALGADVAAQVAPGVSVGTGAGEVVAPVDALAEHAYLILPSPFGLSTAEVYLEADRLGLARSAADLGAVRRQLEAALAPGARMPESLIVNDLQPAAVSLRAEIELALDDARHAGAAQAIVCGSGPTVAGVYWGDGAQARAAVGAAALAGTYPEATAVVPVLEPVGTPEFEAQSEADG
jgi:4-diphosphocytidyl-2-C-methyl-D-erythritol kinase